MCTGEKPPAAKDDDGVVGMGLVKPTVAADPKGTVAGKMETRGKSVDEEEAAEEAMAAAEAASMMVGGGRQAREKNI